MGHVQCALMISVTPALPPVSAHQCQLSALINATCQCPSMPHISAHLSCLSVPPISGLAVPVSAAYQCHMSAAFQCPSVMPVNAHHCHLPVPPHQ
ncbi:unnamed protein product, partial [Staurois parvus]